MIYLDNSATTRCFPEAVEAAAKYMQESFFNPAGAYSPAVASEREVNAARKRIASVLGAEGEELVFTSGGTESNNAAIHGSLRAQRGGGRVLVSAVEHPSVYTTAQGLDGRYEVLEIPVDREGAVELEKLEELLRPDTLFVSVMQVNNETGAVNDMRKIHGLVKRRCPGAVVHVDGVQGFLKADMELRFCDLYSISGHKFHGPKGVGALFIKKGLRFLGGQTGGGQERNLRSGTLNTPGIMGMDAAVSRYMKDRSLFLSSMRNCKERLSKNLLQLPDTVINGPSPDRGAPHILNVSFLGVRGEVLLHALEQKEIYVSTGSACSSHKKGKNRILNAMGVVGERQEGAIRFSFCPFNTEEEMDRVAQAISDQLALLRRFKRR